jgi:hypothetical protein
MKELSGRKTTVPKAKETHKGQDHSKIIILKKVMPTNSINIACVSR